MEKVQIPVALDEGFTEEIPERKLLGAILAQALRDYVGTAASSATAKEDKEAAQSWVEEISLAAWGFDWVCQHLDLDPSAIRRAMRSQARSCPAALSHLISKAKCLGQCRT